MWVAWVEVLAAVVVWAVCLTIVASLIRAAGRLARNWLHYWRLVRAFKRQVDRVEIIKGQWWERTDK